MSEDVEATSLIGVEMEGRSGFSIWEKVWWKVEKCWEYLLQRFIHRNHILKMHEPEYRDPGDQIIYAIAALVNRYVEEERLFAVEVYGIREAEDMSASEVMHACLRWLKEEDEKERRKSYSPEALDMIHGVNSSRLAHYERMIKFTEWWERVEDNHFLDFDSSLDDAEMTEIGIPVDADLKPAKVTEMMNLVIESRGSMWT